MYADNNVLTLMIRDIMNTRALIICVWRILSWCTFVRLTKRGVLFSAHACEEGLLGRKTSETNDSGVIGSV